MTITFASAEIFDKVLGKLTSGQRLDAIRRLDEAGSNEWRMGSWFVTGAGILLVLLLMLFMLMK